MLTVAQLPNLASYKPAGWSDKIVAATNSSSTLDAGIIYSHQDVYVSWATANNSTNGDISSRFYVALYVDSLLNQTWSIDGLAAGYYSYIAAYNLGKLTVGPHTLRIEADTTGAVSESNENDNSYTKTLIVSSTNSVPPRLSAPARTANGPFQFTLTGIPLRSYEIWAATNLTNWQVLTTLVNSNGNGVMLYADPGATNLPRRFYRGRLLKP